jgi:hypothetical protein
MNWVTDIAGAADVQPSLPAADYQYNTVSHGAGVLMQGDDLNHCMIVLTGTMSDGSHVLQVEESDLATTSFSAVASGGTVTLDNTKTNSAIPVNFKRNKAYVRVSATTSGATSGGYYGACFIAQKKIN